MKLKELFESQQTPRYLYHASYEPLLRSIMTSGLGGRNQRKNWSDSRNDVVYLAKTFEVAESYAETSEMVPDEWLDQIVILQIDTKYLNKSKLSLDTNVLGNNGDTLEYNAVIPPHAIRVYKR